MRKDMKKRKSQTRGPSERRRMTASGVNLKF